MPVKYIHMILNRSYYENIFVSLNGEFSNIHFCEIEYNYLFIKYTYNLTED